MEVNGNSLAQPVLLSRAQCKALTGKLGVSQTPSDRNTDRIYARYPLKCSVQGCNSWGTRIDFSHEATWLHQPELCPNKNLYSTHYKENEVPPWLQDLHQWNALRVFLISSRLELEKKSNALKELCIHECVYVLCMFVYECVCLCMHAEARSGIKCPMLLIPRSFEAGSLPEPLSPAKLKASKPQKVFCFSCL